MIDIPISQNKGYLSGRYVIHKTRKVKFTYAFHIFALKKHRFFKVVNIV